jgi:hypothetical protein
VSTFVLAGLVIALQAPPAPPRTSPPPLVRVAPVEVDRTPPPAELFTRAVPPKPAQPLSTYISSDDYPASALRYGWQGRVEFALRVGTDGRPLSCSVLNHGSAYILEVATCQLYMTRTRFEPARDAGGAPVEGAVRAQVQWTLPPAPPLPDRIVQRHRIRADGKASECVLELVRAGEMSRTDDPGCEKLRTPPAVLKAIRGQSALSEPRVRMEVRMLASPAEPWPDLRLLNGEKLLARSHARLDVDGEGRVTSCIVLDSTTLIGQAPNPCRSLRILPPWQLPRSSELRSVVVLLLEGEPKMPDATRAAGATPAARN